jgi:hypothetical protein
MEQILHKIFSDPEINFLRTIRGVTENGNGNGKKCSNALSE